MANYLSNINKYYLFNIIRALELTVSIFVLFLLSNHLTMIQVMFLESLFITAVLLLEVPSGAFADIYGRKLSLALAMIFSSISYALFGLGSAFFGFFIAQMIMAISWALTSGADSALIYDSLKEEFQEKEYAHVFGVASFLSMFVFAFSALLSGFLAIYLEYSTIFFITAAIFFSGFLISLTFKEPPVHKKVHEKHYLQHLKEAIKFSYTHKSVRNLIIYYGLFAALSHLTWFILQPYYKEPGIVGVATFLYFITAAIGTLFANKIIKNVKENPLLLWLLFISSISFMGIFFVDKLTALVLISIMSFACGVRDIVVSEGINKHTDSHHRATVISLQSMSKSVMYAIFAPIIGFFTDVFSAEAAFLMMGMSLFIFMVYYFLLSRIAKSA